MGLIQLVFIAEPLKKKINITKKETLLPIDEGWVGRSEQSVVIYKINTSLHEHSMAGQPYYIHYSGEGFGREERR